MFETKDYGKVGETSYLARVHFDDGDWVYSKDGPQRHCPSLAEAERWLKKQLASRDAGWWGLVEKGTWVEDTFIDHGGFGKVFDASWEIDESFEFEALFAGVATNA